MTKGLSNRANPRVILASASPRRADLLNQLGIPFDLVHPEEEPAPGAVGAGEHVLRSARTKAAAVFSRLRGVDGGVAEPFVVLGADTVVCEAGALLGKPRDPQEARQMLSRLSGRTHLVYTGVVLLGPGAGEERTACEVTEVQMRHLTEADIDVYVSSGEPLDKAGAYGIQGRGGRFIERISGCYYNVMGLPLARLSALLEEAGFEFADL